MEHINQLRSSLEKVMNSIREHHVILTGDFNCPDIDWEHLSVQSGAAEKEVQQALIDLSLDFGLHQVHDQPTFPCEELKKYTRYQRPCQGGY